MKAIKDLLKHCMDKNGPRPELDGILIDGNKLICTDTKQLLILTFKENFQTSKNETTMLFDKLPATFQRSRRPKNFVKILDANLGIIDALGFKVCVPMNESGSPATFPDYKRISDPADKKIFKHTKFEFEKRNSADMLLFKATILNRSLFDGRFLAKFAQLLEKTRLTFHVSIAQACAERPLHVTLDVCDISALVRIEYVVMPIVLSDEDRETA